jgi:hypothetical protein
MRDSAIQNAFSPETPTIGPEHEIAQKILDALKGIRYGSLEIIIHDAKVVQIERKEKIRFEARKPEKAGKPSPIRI